MSECKFCHEEIQWGKTADGKPQPRNADGSPHRCQNKNQSPQQPVLSNNANPTEEKIGRLESYCDASATFVLKDGKPHTYAITPDRCRTWKSRGYCVPGEHAAEVWLKVTLDAHKFIQGDTPVAKPDWAATLPAPGTPPEPFHKASELPKETCTSPEGSPAPDPEQPSMSDEDRIRAAMTGMMPSDRVGYRISLAGMVNSVIEIQKTHGRPIDTEEVKREAVALFLWCDGLTTQNIKRGA
jgi:hypothetical protein